MATSTSTVNPGTQRKDNWQLEPVLTFLGFSAFIVYATWRALMNAHWGVEGTQYLAPMYSPYLPEVFHFLGIHVPFLHDPSVPGGLGWLVSPAIFILWAPAGFRATCYYYRKAYYRSFFTAPAACAVDTGVKSPLIALLGTGKKYMGEKVFPMVLQNSHRFFFYLAAGFVFVLSFDAFMAFFLPGWSGIRLAPGNAVLIANVVLLALYTFGCHSYRHLLGGRMDCFSSCPVGNQIHHAWQRQSILNEHHMLFAWLSLFSVGLADFYVYSLSAGLWQEPSLSWTWDQLFTQLSGLFGSIASPQV